MRLETYLFFNGNCEAALAFYRETIGAETLFLMRFKDSPEAADTPPDWQEKVMHATFRIGDREVLASDGMKGAQSKGYAGFSLSIAVDDTASGEKLYAALSDGGQSLIPWQSTFWTKGFGMLVDRFGVPWMVSVAHEDAANPA
jgi:PhnB protein